jgi:hypothetical protein
VGFGRALCFPEFHKNQLVGKFGYALRVNGGLGLFMSKLGLPTMGSIVDSQ